MTTKTHTFDWHQEPEGSFLKWMLVKIAAKKDTPDLFDTLSTVTDHFKNVELEIRVNNVAVDAKSFVGDIEQVMDSEVKREARRMIAEMPRLAGLYEALQDFEEGFKKQVLQAALENDIEMSPEDWQW